MKRTILKTGAVVLVAGVAMSISACAVYSPEPQYGYGNSGYYSSAPYYSGSSVDLNFGGGGYRHHDHGGWRDSGEEHDGGRR